jgi:two-component system, cell cycle response regulator
MNSKDLKTTTQMKTDGDWQDPARTKKGAVLRNASRIVPPLGGNQSPAEAEGTIPASEGPSKILVVDDSPVSRKLVELALCQKAYEVIFAETGKQAVELFRDQRPVLVIMNWTLPDLAGEELCQRLRSMSEEFHTHIIVLTGRTDKNCLIRALAAGADDYLTKPFHEGELIARVGAGLRLAELCRQIAKKSVLLEELALTDSLTGLPNRRAIESWAQTQLSSAARQGFSYWVILADLDHFKQVNDTFGHEAGDAVLKKFSKILKSQLRNGDMCGRFGGEEFLIVMTYLNRENVLKVIDRIRLELQMSPLRFHEATILVTASFGIAGFEQNQLPPGLTKLQSLADTALYSAKMRGRNRVEIAAAVC